MIKSLSLKIRVVSGLGDFCKVLNESPVEANMPQKAPQISNGTWKREVLDDIYHSLVHL